METYYKNFSEKEKYVNRIEIRNFDELKKKLEEYYSKKGIFRGLHNASYKNLTSLSRFCFNNIPNFDEYSVAEYFIRMEFEKVIKLPYMLDLFKNSIRENDIKEIHKKQEQFFIILINFFLNSITQHYGGITEYLDFTRDIYKALFFSIYKWKSIPCSNDINSFVSLYLIEEIGKFILKNLIGKMQ